MVLAVPMVAAIIDLGGDPDEDALQVTVRAEQFNWFFEYSELIDDEGNALSTPRELRVPVDRDIAISLESIDVIHSFWVPKLAGKLDVIPGRTNTMWFNATSPGTYSGQCAEFCGIGHAGMKFTVIALEEAEFQAWCEEELAVEPGAPVCQR
jgi:cytochrome c oxidase subunit 2